MARKLWIALSLVLATGTLRGQAAAPSAQWTAWLGCWQPTAGSSGALTCIVPTKDQAGVQRLSVVDDSIASRETLIADGRPRPSERDGCKGEENASWSKTGTRVYLNGHFSCPGSPGVETTRLYAIATGGDWIEEEQIRSGGGVITRETRYRDAGVPASLPKSISRALQPRSLAEIAARAAASAPPTSADVADAMSFVDSSLVRAWLTQTGARLGGTTVFAPATGNNSYPAGSYSYGSGGGVVIGPNYAPYTPPTLGAPQQPTAFDPNAQAYAYPYAYGYPYAYPYGYGYYPYGLWSAPEIVVPGRARPREPHFWGLGTQPRPQAPPAAPRSRK